MSVRIDDHAEQLVMLPHAFHDLASLPGRAAGVDHYGAFRADDQTILSREPWVSATSRRGFACAAGRNVQKAMRLAVSNETIGEFPNGAHTT
jgi:hypothetical protein